MKSVLLESAQRAGRRATITQNDCPAEIVCSSVGSEIRARCDQNANSYAQEGRETDWTLFRLDVLSVVALCRRVRSNHGKNPRAA
jgi:hypothetical protein